MDLSGLAGADDGQAVAALLGQPVVGDGVIGWLGVVIGALDSLTTTGGCSGTGSDTSGNGWGSGTCTGSTCTCGKLGMAGASGASTRT